MDNFLIIIMVYVFLDTNIVWDMLSKEDELGYTPTYRKKAVKLLKINKCLQ